MIKIFLVEDEVCALRALEQKIIDLHEDYEIAGTAGDGSEALPLILKTHPAIVITDIRMPDMDGISLIRQLKENDCDAMPVILTGYQEFEYAKQAVRLGVEDYLLKPVAPSELEECLAGCARKLRARFSHKNILSFLIGEEAFCLESVTDGRLFAVIYVIMGNALSNLEDTLHPNVSYLGCDKIQEIFSRCCHEKYPFFCYDGIFSNEKVVLVNIVSEEDAAFTLSAGLNQFTRELSERTGMYSTLYYLQTDTNNITHGIQSARKGAVRCMRLGENGIYHAHPVQEPASQNLSETVELLFLLLQQNEAALLRSNVLRMFTQWNDQKLTLYAMEADMIFLLNSLKRRFSARKEFAFDSVFFVENIICFSANYRECAENFASLLLELFVSIREPQETGLSTEQLVRRITDYCQEHLSDNLTLQELSDELHVSKVYLCRVFKKVKNMTPIDYFNRLKIQKSCEMITRFPNLSLREISDTLGYSDVYYFSKVFKKIMGMPPSGYRERK